MNGRTFSHYELLEKLGEGVRGEVYLARDPSLGRRVALKLLPESLQRDQEAKLHFLREAKSAAALEHPYICKMYETGEAEGRSFIAMEFVSGETLERRLTRDPLPIAEALRIASEIAEALEAAHQQSIVHRDLKLSNIILAGGHAKVMGFGLTKGVVSKSPSPGESLAYLSPEQVRGQEVDARSDIFSFGLVLYEMLSGVHPFRKATSADTAAAILTETPPPLSRYRSEVPELLEHVVGKLLAKDPGERYQLVHEVRTDLNHVVDEEGRPSSRPASAPGGMGLRLGLAAVAVLALLAALFWWMGSSRGTLSGGDLSSVAVLPLKNMSDEPLESDYLAEGISQAVITKLAQAGLRVTPWETARRYADSTELVERIARELNVDAVLSGRFQLVRDRIVTTLSLVEAESGLVTWADEFEEPYEDLFRVQRRIAVGAASSLNRKLTGEEEEGLRRPESGSVEAYDFYLQGAHIMQEGTEEATDIAFDYFSRAVELDPDLADAHVGLGAVHSARYWFGWEGGQKNVDWAKESYERALELNPASMTARRGLALVNAYSGPSEACLIQGREAERYGRADDLQTLLTRALAYNFGGLPDRSLPLFRRVIELDPANAEAHFHLVVGSFWARQLEEAINIGNVYIRRFGDDPHVHGHVAASYQLMGNHERAREHYKKATDVAGPSSPVYPLVWAGLFFDEMGEREQAEEVWRRGVALVEPKLEAYPDHLHMRLYLAELYALLGKRGSFSREDQLALETLHGFWLYLRPAVHARLGETERAAELLLRTVRQGVITPFWKRMLEVASAPPLESEVFDQFLREYEAEERRLREMY